jgi:hypothetical protein
MLNQILLPSKFSMAVIHVPCMDMSDLYIDYLLYNKETKLYTVPVSLSQNLYKETHKDNIHKIIPGANIVNYISIDEYNFDQEHWNSWLYEMYYDEWYSECV